MFMVNGVFHVRLHRARRGDERLANPNILTINETLPRFCRSSHIADLMQAMHVAPKLQCTECEREFNWRSHLEKHMRTVHWAFQG